MRLCPVLIIVEKRLNVTLFVTYQKHKPTVLAFLFLFRAVFRLGLVDPPSPLESNNTSTYSPCVRNIVWSSYLRQFEA